MTLVPTEGPRSCLTLVPSERVRRRLPLARTCAAHWITPPSSSSLPVSVVLPASGRAATAKVHRREASAWAAAELGVDIAPLVRTGEPLALTLLWVVPCEELGYWN